MRRPLAVLAIACCSLLAACGGSSHGGSSDGPLVVSAAASLQSAFTRYGATFEHEGHGPVHFSFAGSDALAAQIEQGMKPDVFASADMKLPNGLHAKGLLESPQAFASNRLVLAVPAGSSKITSLGDARKPGVTLAVGSKSVPIGLYTRTVLAKLRPGERRAIVANIDDEEPDVTGILGKLTEGAVDGGFVYLTDVKAADGKLEAIELPADVQPQVAYGIAAVHGTPQAAEAAAFIEGVQHGAGHADLMKAGFLPAPAAR